MATIVTMTILAMFALSRWRDLPAVRPLHRLLVESPARWGNALTRRHMVFATLMLIVVVTGGQMLAALGPLDMSLVFLWDVSAFVDVAIAATTLAAGTRIARHWRLVALWRPGRARPRRPRARRREAAPKPGNDDDGAGRWALAA